MVVRYDPPFKVIFIFGAIFFIDGKYTNLKVIYIYQRLFVRLNKRFVLFSLFTVFHSAAVVKNTNELMLPLC